MGFTARQNKQIKKLTNWYFRKNTGNFRSRDFREKD